MCQISVDAEYYTNYADGLLLFDNLNPARSSSQIIKIIWVPQSHFAVTSVKLPLNTALDKTCLCLLWDNEQ